MNDYLSNVTSKRICARFALSLGFLFAFGNLHAATAAKNLRSCIAAKAHFDGIRTLTYAEVQAENGQGDVALYSSYPSNCSGRSPVSCGTKFSLPGGRSVAVSKRCGSWAYVQYIRTNDVVEGWISRRALKRLPSRLPFDDGEPGGREPSVNWTAPTRIRVKLIEGRGLPVCEAYLQRLNQTIFHEPPPCGRPENDQIPGFARLSRVPLSVSSANKLYIQAYDASHPFWLRLSLHRPAQPEKGVIAEWIPSGEPPQPVQRIFGLKASDDISVWRFVPEVDIDNDGQPDNVIIWRGFPPNWNLPQEEACGVETGEYVSPESDIDEKPLVLAPDGDSIDTLKTRELFGTPTPRPPGPGVEPSDIQFLGNSLGIFEYRGQYYIDNVDSTKRFRVVVSMRNQILVYKRAKGHLEQLCTYRDMDTRWKPL